MERALRLHRPAMPWGLLVAFELIALALLSAMLVLATIPGAFDVDWGCVTSKGETRTAGDTYIASFAVSGALGWLIVAGITAFAYSSSRRRLALIVPAVFFALITGLALLTASAIGPLPC